MYVGHLKKKKKIDKKTFKESCILHFASVKANEHH